MTAILVFCSSAFDARAQYTIGQRVWTPPLTGSYFSLQSGGTNFPPTPFLPYDPIQIPVYSLNGSNSFIYDDSEVQNWQMSESNPPIPGEGGGGLGTNNIPPAYSNYGSNDLWLEITITNTPADFVFLTLHGTTSTNFYQLQSKTNLGQSNWSFGQILFSANDGQTDFDPVSTFGQPENFFRAQKAPDVIQINAQQDALEPTNSQSGQTGIFQLVRNTWRPDIALTITYKVSGSATMGLDYTNITGTNLIGTVTFPPFVFTTNIFIKPIVDNLIEFEESVTVAILRTNGYIVDPSSESATNWIADNFGSNIFTVVATNIAAAGGIDYHPGSNALIVSVHSINDEPFNFVRIDANGSLFRWSSVSNLTDEIKLAIVKTNLSGFGRGDMYFGTGVNGIVGKLSADALVQDTAWATLTTNQATSETLLRGSLYVDQTGAFSNQLIVVTGNSPDQGGGVWLIGSNTNAVELANITNQARPHLEGVVTLPDDASRWGPWAGKIITGAESKSPPLVHAIDPSGTVTSFDLRIEPEDFDVIEPNQDLYCVDQGDAETLPPKILKLSRTLLTNYWGDLLITQEGTQPADPTAPHHPKLFILHWDSTNAAFVTRRISHDTLFEHVTFAPLNIPDL
jgi:hypothetical protein